MVLVQRAWAIRWAASKAAMPEKTPLLMSTGAAGAGAGVARVRALELGLGLELVLVLGGELVIGGLAALDWCGRELVEADVVAVLGEMG
jgi:hypothetical protein